MASNQKKQDDRGVCVPRPGLEKLSEISRTLKKSPSLGGLCHLGRDGVYRSFNSSGDVVDYKQLNEEQIQSMLDGYKILIDGDAYRKAVENFQGVDGTKVTDENDLLHPKPEIMPERFRGRE